MRKLIVPLLLLFLCGCSSGTLTRETDRLRQRFLDAEELQLDARLTADYGDRDYSFLLRLQKTDFGWEILVLEPENLSGLTARCQDGSIELQFEDLILDTGDLNSRGLSPMNALPMIADAWKNGHLEEVIRTGDDLFSIQYIVDDGISVLTVFDPESSLPLRAELSVDGATVIFCEFQDVILR